jgi:hypothetical protein
MLEDKRAQQLLQAVHRVCVATLPTLSRTRKHRSRDLCGEDFWAPLSRGRRICAGLCIAYLVREKHLPLRLHETPRGKGSKAYWIS